MMRQQTKLFDRLFAAALLIAILIGAYAVVIAPIFEHLRTAHETITEQRVLLGRLRAELDRTPGIPNEPTDGTADARGTVFLPGTSNATRVANLQARLGALVANANVAVLSARATAPETRDGLPMLGVEIAFRATDAQLESLLTAIERDRPFLFVDGLELTPAPSEAEIDQTASTRNDVTLRIVGVVEKAQG